MLYCRDIAAAAMHLPRPPPPAPYLSSAPRPSPQSRGRGSTRRFTLLPFLPEVIHLKLKNLSCTQNTALNHFVSGLTGMGDIHNKMNELGRDQMTSWEIHLHSFHIFLGWRTILRYGRLWPWPTTLRRSRSCPIPSLGFPTSEGSLDTRSPSSISFASYFEH